MLGYKKGETQQLCGQMPAHYPADRVTLFGNPNADTETALTYSETEHIVGRWIDGSPIYGKTIVCGVLPNNAEKTVAHNISNLKFVLDIRGIAIRETNPIAYPMPFLALDNLNYGIQVNVGTTNVVITTKSNLSYLDKSYVNLMYLKTS